jgi:hypothetical protein
MIRTPAMAAFVHSADALRLAIKSVDDVLRDSGRCAADAPELVVAMLNFAAIVFGTMTDPALAKEETKVARVRS